MDPKDLMINDLVYIPFMELMTIPKRKTKKIDIELLSNNKALKAVSPIPISEEILENNGFKKCLDNDNATYYCINNFSIHYYNKGNYFYLDGKGFCIHFYYIHELQHILRLCELNDLANDFKI